MLYDMPYTQPPPPLFLCLNVHLAGSPRDVRAQTPAVSVPSSYHAPYQAPEERDVDWEDYDYERESAAGGGSQAENPFAALLIKLQARQWRKQWR